METSTKNSNATKPSSMNLNYAVRSSKDSLNVKSDKWISLEEETAIAAVEMANYPSAHQNAHTTRYSLLNKRRRGSTLSHDDNTDFFTNSKRSGTNRRQSLPVQLELFHQKHGVPSPRSSRNTATQRRGSVQKHMPVIGGGFQSGNKAPKRRARRQSLSVLDPKNSATKPQQTATPPSDESEDEFHDYLADIPKITDKPKVTYSREEVADPLKKITREIFLQLDENCDGLVDKNDITKLLRSPKLDVPFDYHDINIIFSHLEIKEKGKIGLKMFGTLFRELLRIIYGRDDDSKQLWVELEWNNRLLYFNKQTGESRVHLPEDYLQTDAEADLFEEAVLDILKTILSNEQKRKVSADDFKEMLRSMYMSFLLTEEDIQHINLAFGSANVELKPEQFVRLAKHLITVLYQTKDDQPLLWRPMLSPRFGMFWFNKQSGESRKYPPHHVLRSQQHLMQRWSVWQSTYCSCVPIYVPVLFSSMELLFPI